MYTILATTQVDNITLPLETF